MKLDEAKFKFIETWGRLGTEWGINRTMAQVHALFLVSTEPLSTDDVMEALSISRGNANMNIRDLINWDLVHKVMMQGERKEYFAAEKNIWEIAKRIIRERKRREIEPLKRTLSELKNVDGDKRNKDVKEFTELVENIDNFIGKLDGSLDTMIKADESWFWGSVLKIMK